MGGEKAKQLLNKGYVDGGEGLCQLRWGRGAALCHPWVPMSPGSPSAPKSRWWGLCRAIPDPSTHVPPTPRKGHQALGTRTQVYFFLAAATHSHHPQAQSSPPPVQGVNWDQWTVGTGTGGGALPPPRTAGGHVQLHQPPLQTCPLQGHGQETPRGCSDVPKGQQSSCRGMARTWVLLGKGQGRGAQETYPPKNI